MCIRDSSDANFNVQADVAVIEVDELTLYRQFKALRPTALVVNNFFRDQLDRAGEMETIIRKIEEVTENFEGDLIMNGDDPNVVRIAQNAKKAKVHYFSVGQNEVSQKTTNEASEGKDVYKRQLQNTETCKCFKECCDTSLSIID